MKIIEFPIGQLAKQVGCSVETIHFYEKTGIMPKPPRTEGGHRIYTPADVKRLGFIRRSRDLGFSIEQIIELLKFIDESNHYCGEVKAMALQQSIEVQKKIDALLRLKKALYEVVCECKGGDYSIDNCPIIDALYTEKE